ncbi:unnamed protein product [Brachionus calyciflorus]|uniref:Uncharacterized protein n=1 Tax=Brachionus calyciflorus TaxID=104777 RepID=A0A814BNW3_9BILA|nr:unnamed protein product [Brachionus calyciflorus]
MKVVGTINNNSVVYALDSGASISVVAYKIVKTFNFKINPTNIQVKVADNTINDAIGETDTLRICIGNSIIYQKILIIDLDDNDVLLGLDWFLKSGATLTPVEKCFRSKIMDEDWPLNDKEPNLNIEPATSLDAMEYKLFRKALGSLCDLFAYSIKDLKVCTMGKHTIKPIRLQS